MVDVEEASDEDDAAEQATEKVYNYDVDLFVDDVVERAV
jgi:hypothetical protein